MAHSQAPGADSENVPPPSAEGSGGRGGTGLETSPRSNSADKHAASEGQERINFSWLNDLKSNNQRRPDPEDDDEADYRAENEDHIEPGAPDVLRTKSSRISKQVTRAHEAM